MSVGEIVRALLIAGLPIAALSFALIWYALVRGIMEPSGGFNAMRKNLDSLGKQQKKKEEKKRLNPVHDKWFRFGGGFYGVVAMYTMIRIEWDDVMDFVGRLDDLLFRLDIGVLINFFINSLMNFIAAISWPVYWLNVSGGGNRTWIWLGIAYGGYYLGSTLAQVAVRRAWGGRPEQFIREFGGNGKEALPAKTPKEDSKDNEESEP